MIDPSPDQNTNVPIQGFPTSEPVETFTRVSESAPSHAAETLEPVELDTLPFSSRISPDPSTSGHGLQTRGSEQEATS